MKYLRIFNTHSEYNSYTESEEFVSPSVQGVREDGIAYFHDMSENDRYLRTEILQDGTISFSVPANLTNYVQSISYSKDGGDTWVKTDNASSGMTITVNVQSGDTVSWKGSGIALAANKNTGCSFSSTCEFNVDGNPLSLLYENNFGKITSYSNDNILAFLFQGCTNLIHADNLQLNVTTLSEYCYFHMFYGCSKLESVPSLPSTALTEGCYSDMFRACTSLTTAPELPATTLVKNCYSAMFQGCTSLTYIKAMFTTTPSSDYMSNWVSGITTTGIFVKNIDATWSEWDSNNNHIPQIPQNFVVETKRSLPSGYKQLVYIASTKSGGEYLDLGLQMWSGSPLSYELDIAFYPIGKGKDNHTQATILSCLKESGNFPGFLIRINNNTVLQQNRNPQKNYSSSFNVSAFVRQNQGNGSERTFTPDRGTTDTTLTMFCELSASGVPQRFFESRVYYARIKSNGDDWVRDCVPAENSIGVLGLFDLANNVFYTTPQGEFVSGGELV